MSRPVVVLFVLFALGLQTVEAQTFSRGAPASVVSPTPDGQMHGVPASVVSPTPLPPGVHPMVPPPRVRVRGPLRRFGSSHRQQAVFVPVPLFYSYYTDPSFYPSVADPPVQDTAAADPAQAQQQQQQQPAERNDDDLRAAYLQGAHDALAQKDDSRYGQHYLDSRERERQQTVADASPRSERTAAPPAEDKTPPTVFIFKDGHQLETKNYAIMGETLFDFSGAALKKIKIADLDTTATLKANDDRGVVVKLQ
ncbi:MAG TPA: hypothetical protein VIB39_20925 [Candidatus Angelobacter sp.]|jgi:hypothetical protein